MNQIFYGVNKMEPNLKKSNNASLAAILVVFALVIGGAVWGTTSTIDPSVPANGAPLNSGPVRNNFSAAYNDINNIYSTTLPNTLASGKIFVGNSSNIATGVTMSGACSINNAGVISCSSTPSGNSVNLLAYGAQCDESFFTDGVSVASSATITSAMTTFTPSMVGDIISIVGAGTAGATLITTIAGYGDAHTITIATPASSSHTGSYGTFGYNNDTPWALAIAAAYNGGIGGTVVFPAHCAATHIVTYRNVMLDGLNQTSCFLRQLPGANQDFIVTENQAALHGTGYNFGPTGVFNGYTSNPLVPSWFGIKNCVVDGNSLGGNTSGRVWASYGNMTIFQNVLFEQGAGDNIYTEAAAAYAYNATNYRAAEEGIFDNVTSRNSGGYAWHCQGPHDASFHNILGLESAHGFLQDGAVGSIGAPNGTGCGGNFVLMHFYTMSDGINMTFNSGGQADFIYDDFGGTVLNIGTSNYRAIQCAIGGIPCMKITGQDVTVMGASISPQIFSGINNTVLVQLQGVFDNIYGLDVSLYNLLGGNIGVSMEANFQHIDGAINGGIGLTNDVCVKALGSYDWVSFSGANCNNGIQLGASEHDNIFKMYTFGTTTPFANSTLSGAGTPHVSDIIEVNNASTTDDTGGTRYSQMHALKTEYIINQGAKFSVSGCTPTSLLGGSTAGSFAVAAVTPCVAVITMGNTATAPNGWVCTARDETTGTAMQQTAHSTTTCTISGNTSASDVLSFSATGY